MSKRGIIGLLVLLAAIGAIVAFGPKQGTPPEASVSAEAVASFAVPAPAPASVTARGTALYRVNLGARVKRADREAVAARGGRVVSVLPPDGLLIESTPDVLRAFLALGPARTATAVSASDKLAGGLDTASDALQTVTIVPVLEEDFSVIEARLAELEGTSTEFFGLGSAVPCLRAKIPGTALLALAENAEVSWIEPYVPPHILNDCAVRDICLNVETVWENYGLTGAGQIIVTSDTGIDTGNLTTLHEDLRDNLLGYSTYTFYTNTASGGYARATTLTYDANGHGTHTAGSLVGTGAKSDGQIKGVAYGAKLWAWFCEAEDGTFYLPSSYTDLFRSTSNAVMTNAYLHSASWGGDTNVYSTSSQGIDNWCWNNPDLLPVFAAGNDGYDAVPTICAEAGAKNVLGVGATENFRTNAYSSITDNPDDHASFSSYGPMPDGRMKPDVCAPGSYVVSTRSTMSTNTLWGVFSNTNYIYCGGTSMATPLVTGTLALIREHLTGEGGFTNTPPSSALMKAIITGGATRLGDGAPNSSFGWGRANLGETLFPTNGLSAAFKDYIPFDDASSEEYVFSVTNAEPLVVQLCWIDYPATPSAALTKSLVIDLDLVVSNHVTGAVWTPDDHLNNLEAVTIDAAEPGTYSVFVKGTSTAYSSDDGGAAALYVRGALGMGLDDAAIYYLWLEEYASGEEEIVSYEDWSALFKEGLADGTYSEADAGAKGDPDGDGFANGQEFTESTGPTDSTTFPFCFVDLTPSNLTYIGSLTGTISLQHVLSLGDTWTNVFEDTTTRASVTNVYEYAGTPVGFFRLTHEP